MAVIHDIVSIQAKQSGPNVISCVEGELTKVSFAVSDKLDNFAFVMTPNSSIIFPGKIRQMLP